MNIGTAPIRWPAPSPFSEVKGDIKIYPLPHMPVGARPWLPVPSPWPYAQLASIEPWLKSSSPTARPARSAWQVRLRSAGKLDGLWECILCFLLHDPPCPSLLVDRPSAYLGPAILLQAYRWIADSRGRGERRAT